MAFTMNAEGMLVQGSPNGLVNNQGCAQPSAEIHIAERLCKLFALLFRQFA
jgi:hypothetical protein